MRKDGLGPAEVSAVGPSAAMPVDEAGGLKGPQPTARLAACWQPDRRVEIEVVGTR